MKFLKKNARVLITAILVITALFLVALMMVPQVGNKLGFNTILARAEECGCKVRWEVHSMGYGKYENVAVGCECDGDGPWQGSQCEKVGDWDTDSPSCSGYCWK